MARTKSTARIVPAKHNDIKFQALCAALRRNDPTVTAVTATSRGDTPHAYGRRLGMALRHNTTVTKIDVHVGFLLSGKSTTASASTLIDWIQACPSLHNVTLQSRYPHNWSPDVINEVYFALLQRLLQAAAQNSAVQAIELPCLEHIPLTVWTHHLTNGAIAAKIHSLTLLLKEEASDAELEAAAQAIGVLPRLKELHLAGTNVPHILRELQSDKCPIQLTHLTLSSERSSHPKEYPESTMTLLSNVVRKSKQLQHLTLHHVKVKAEGWRLVSAALQTNPSVNELTINNVSFTKEALKLFLNDMQCNDELKQHIRRLTLSFYDVACRAKHLASALCCGGSLILHLSIRTHLMEDKAVFRIWRQHAATLPLESLHILGGVTTDMLQDMACILADTVYLRRLTCQMSSYPRKNIEVPHSFLVAVQRNASLHEMTLQYWNGSSVRITPDQTKNDAIARIMKAITLRNRLLPDLITRAFGAPPANRSTEAHNDKISTGATAAARQFPALCVVATTAPRMAPNTVLKGLLPTLDALRPIHLRDSKRGRNNHV